MFRLLRWFSVTHRSIAVRIAMNMADTGVVITIGTDSTAFPVTVGTTAKRYGSLRASISMALAIFTAVSAISVIREATSPANLS